MIESGIEAAPLDIFDPQMEKSKHNSGAGLGGAFELAGV
jgi:hypothetical protein